MYPVQIYKLQDEQEQQRLQELTDTDNPTGLEMELGVLRFLQDQALNRGEPHFAVEICKAIGQLSHAAETAKIRRGELLAKSVVLGIAKQIAELLANDVAGRFVGWEDCIDGVRQKVLTLVCEAKNPDPD